MLCALCVSIFQDPKNEGYHHKNRHDLCLASENSCKICSFVYRQTSNVVAGVDPSQPLKYRFSQDKDWRGRVHLTLSIFHKSADVTEDLWLDQNIYIHVSNAQCFPPNYPEFIQMAISDLETAPFLVRPDVPMGRDIPDNTGHEAVAQLAKGWFEECKLKHSCDEYYEHRQVGWYPKRLVHIGQGNERPRLVLRDEDDLRGPYATLSHCWGDNPDFFVLNADNLEDLRKEIPVERLAASFRDAILTCHRLQIPYLWIDSLCILQAGHTSQSDWLFHTNEMHNVYLNCELNIAIDVSDSPHEGAFRSRDPRIVQDCYTWTPCHGLSDVPLYSPERETRINLCAIFTNEDFSWARELLPLNRRAWVFQEALLSPRALRFGNDRIWWECTQKRTLSECMPNSQASGIDGGFDCFNQPSFNIERSYSHNLTSYFGYVTSYGKRKLSHPNKDKFVAFAAIARLCAHYFGGGDYCAGIFRNSMPWGLLWYIDADRPGRRPESYRAPSWSWASLDISAEFDYHDRQPNILSHVTDVSIQLVDTTDPFGQVKSAALTLRGPLISSQALAGQGSTEQSTTWLEMITIVFRFSPPEQHPHYYPSLGKNLYFLCIGEVECSPKWKDTSGTYGLILRKADNGSFSRLGRWKAKVRFIQRHAGTEYELRPETITLL
ncbi:unnamed protein product [Clonostachys rosea]|uniref:Heterokaryon incompatibility domain-containing protein n=1 Tax=Bionectria ochroleuca TaxID=29856 RepID=A0ABY6UDX1_BIOOC|nr:unnamed protein product [Clonostachys rosea]